MKHLIKFLTMALLIMVSAIACNRHPKVVSPIEVPNLDSLQSYIDKAPKTNDAMDQYCAAVYHLFQYTTSDSTKAIDLLSKSAAQDLGVAAYHLGYIYANDSTNSYYDIKKAVEYYELGVKKGSDEAMINLANLYIKGQGVQRNYKKALQLRSDAILGLLALAEKGDAAAQWRLGAYLADGTGVSINKKEGFEWVKKSADQDYTPALYSVALCYKDGIGMPEKNLEEAFKYFKKAADKGHTSSLFWLGQLYESGSGAERSDMLAFKNYLKAAELGNKDAMFAAALAYENGKGTEINYNEAFKWYKKCADLGNVAAQNNIGAMYDSGRGVAQDYKEAFKWFLKAAEAGLSSSQRIVGNCYYSGEGVERDITKAFEWFKKGAMNGDKIAMHNLAACYYNGLGTAKDAATAKYWEEQSNY